MTSEIQIIPLEFGELRITPLVVERLKELDYTAEDLVDAIKEHKSTDDSAAVYVGTYHKYNCGSICGLWVDIESFYEDYDDFIAFCQAIHADEDDPELMFQDYQGFPREYYDEGSMSEKNFDQINLYLDMCVKHGDEAVDDCIEAEISLEDFDEAYEGHFKKPADFAQFLAEDVDGARRLDTLAQYIDYQRYADDLFGNDYFYGSHGHVFRNL
jgi:antirestriction protein